MIRVMFPIQQTDLPGEEPLSVVQGAVTYKVYTCTVYVIATL